MAFECPPDCGHCCTHLEREPAPGDDDFRAVLREEGIYHCTDSMRLGLALSTAEAERLTANARTRGMKVDIHPRTYLLETRRRLAVVLDWHMPYASCPFYADFKCTVYEARPLVCRAYPVLLASPLAFAPECPKQPAPSTQVRMEQKARRAIDAAHAALDDAGWRALASGRFAKGLPVREAAARLRRYRPVPLEEYLRTVPARSSTS